jgi:hypothetical protein
MLLLLLLLLSHSPYTDPYDGSTKQGPELTLVPEVGKPAKVVILNVYAGKVSPGRWSKYNNEKIKIHIINNIKTK